MDGPTIWWPKGAGGTFVRRDSLDTGLRVPMWLLFTF